MNVLKRDCTSVPFDKNKIYTAIMKAMKNGSGIVKPKIADEIANEIYEAHTRMKSQFQLSNQMCLIS